MFKLVVNQLDKIFITRDKATIVKEMEFVHPAEKLIVEAAQKQEQEVWTGLFHFSFSRLVTERTSW